MFTLNIKQVSDNEVCACAGIPCEPKAQTLRYSKCSISGSFFYPCICVMSQREAIPNMVILGTQLYPLSVKIFCLQEAANQKKAGSYLIYGTVLKV